MEMLELLTAANKAGLQVGPMFAIVIIYLMLKKFVESKIMKSRL